MNRGDKTVTVVMNNRMTAQIRSDAPHPSSVMTRRTTMAVIGAGLAAALAKPARARAVLPPVAVMLRPISPSQPAPTEVFTTGDGQKRTLADYRGKGVVLNLWATWCLPCKLEMPSLDHLAELVASDRISVLPVSIDTGGRKAVAAFYRENRIAHLPILLDPSSALPVALKAPGVPTTVILDRAGRIVGRVVGAAAWDAPESVALLRRLVGAGA